MTNTNVDLPEKEVEERILIAMRLVHDLFGQLHNFYKLVLEVLASIEMDVKPLTRKFFIMPKQRGDPPATTYCKSHLGLVAELAAASGDESEDEELDYEGDEDEVEEKSSKKGMNVSPDSQFLIIKTVLFDLKNTATQPCAVAAILSSLESKGRKDGKRKSSFKIKRRDLLRLADEVKDGVRAEDALSRRIPKFDLSCRVTAIEKRSLATFREEKDVSDFINQILSHVS